MILYLVKQFDNSFKVSHNSDYEKLKKIKAGATVKCTITQPRNVQFHRKYFALINLVYQNQERYSNIDHLRNDLTIASGYYTERKNIKDEIIIEAESISFASMKQDDFNNLYSATLDAIVKYFSFDRKSMIDEIEQYF